MGRKIKRLFLMIFDTSMITLSHLISYIFLYPLININKQTFITHLIIVVALYLLMGWITKVFDKINRFSGIYETVVHLIIITFSFVIGTLVYQTVNGIISFRYVTFSYLISGIILPVSRLIWRVWVEYIHKIQHANPDKTSTPKRILLIGAGEVGAFYVKSLKNRSDINIVGILDDSSDKQGTTLYSYPIIGKIIDLERLVKQYNVQQVTLAIPSLSKSEKRKIVKVARKLNVKTNQMPYIEDVLSGNYKSDEFKDIEIADLLGRDEVSFDGSLIADKISGKTILVSGAGGSIGSEICRQISRYSPKKIILLGHGEFSIYKIERELRQQYERNFETVPVIADIQDRERIFEVFDIYKPEIVYHAAAHKHVPLMEKNVREAVKNNIMGTKNIAEAAKASEVESFVMISTDKAVNPPNVMGATKRIAEMIVTGLNEPNKTNFVAVRFGNVLNSSGSVIPIFKEQIENGGPVTITDFRMTRYFMTIPEASRLVMQAGVLANGGEVFVLDMGEPVKILDLAKQMIWLSGYNDQEIQVIETGMRPGEKLYEELLASDENTKEMVFEKIFVGKVHNLPIGLVLSFVNSLEELGEEKLKEIIIDFANNTYDENIKMLTNAN